MIHGKKRKEKKEKKDKRQKTKDKRQKTKTKKKDKRQKTKDQRSNEIVKLKPINGAHFPFVERRGRIIVDENQFLQLLKGDFFWLIRSNIHLSFFFFFFL